MMAGFEIAPQSERVLGLGDYLLGVLFLVVLLGACWYAARRLRRAALPQWTGAPALLCEAVGAAGVLIVASEVVGTFGAFTEAGLLVAVLALAAAAALGSGWLARRVGSLPPPPAPANSTLATWIAVAACAAVAAGWAVPTLAALAGGMDRADSLWYHMPLAAKFVQTGSVGEIFFFDPIFFASFYPANSEVLHAAPILGFGRDIVSPVLNLGFLGLGLLAAWCIGRPYGVAPQALLGGAIALGAEMLVEFQAGEALNDITGTVFIMAAAAILVNGYAAAGGAPSRGGGAVPLRSLGARQRPRMRGLPGTSRSLRETAPPPGHRIAGTALAVAGLAAGLAAGMKFSFLAPVAALTLGVVVLAGRGERVRAGAVWTLPMLAGCGYWYVRNAIATGNPIPQVASIGPLELPAPERAFELRPGFSVAHYLGDPEVWWDWFVPGLEDSFGALWPLTLLAAVAAGALALSARSGPALRLLGAMVLVTAVAYAFTPLTAAGEEGEPIAFVWNVRYLAPAVAVGLALVPCLPAVRDHGRRRAAATAALAVLLAVTVGSLVQWQQGHTKGAVAAAAAVLAAGGAYAFARSRGWLGPAATRRSLALAGCLVVVAGLAAGYAGQRHYLERRYENLSPERSLAGAMRWAQDLRGARVAVGGVRGVFNQYPLYGADLSNAVQWLGLRGEHDAWLRIADCATWRRELNSGGYTHVVTTYDPFTPGRLADTKEGLWTRSDPATSEVLRDGPVSVFELEGPLDPAGCEGLPELVPAELNGDSVNAEPLANDPGRAPGSQAGSS